MNDYTDRALRFVMDKMPAESTAALMKFTERNPHWRGANWDDCLAVLMDSDSHLEVTEPLFEALPQADPTMVCAVAITLLYASQAWAEMPTASQAMAVAATIHDNGGS